VANEQWHPQQKGKFEADGSYLLEIPYSHNRELVMDILRHGAEVEVIAPQKLRKRVGQELKATLEFY
jgi:predicted DNA-binding transcriptional regulator YafY